MEHLSQYQFEAITQLALSDKQKEILLTQLDKALCVSRELIGVGLYTKFELRDVCRKAKPQNINSPVCDAIVRKKHYYMHEVLRDVAEENEGLHEFIDFLTDAAASWKMRNDAMRANISAHAKNLRSRSAHCGDHRI